MAKEKDRSMVSNVGESLCSAGFVGVGGGVPDDDDAGDESEEVEVGEVMLVVVG